MPALAPAPSPEARAAAPPRATRFEPGTLVQHRSLNSVFGCILSAGEDGLSISVWPAFDGFKYIGEHELEVKKQFPYDDIVLLSENPLASLSSGRSAACYGSRLHTVCKSEQGCYAVGMQRPGFPKMSLGDPVEINIAEYEHPALRGDLRYVLAGFVKTGKAAAKGTWAALVLVADGASFCIALVPPGAILAEQNPVVERPKVADVLSVLQQVCFFRAAAWNAVESKLSPSSSSMTRA
jgi:hypothetical protein